MIAKSASIVVAGSSGFLGAAVLERLRARGYSRARGAGRPQYDFTVLSDCMGALEGAQVLINTAGLVTSRRDQQLRPADILYTNTLIPLQLLEAARRQGVQTVIHIGSITGYLASAQGVLREEDMLGSFAPELSGSSGFYGLSRWFVGVAARAYGAQHPMRQRVLIFPNLYGPDDKFDDEFPPLVPNIIRTVVSAVRGGQAVVSLGSKPRTGLDMLFVADAAEAVCALISKDKSPEPFLSLNAGSGQFVTIEQVAHEIVGATKFRGKIAWEDKLSGGKRRLDSSTIEKVCGWHAKTSLKRGIAQTVSWFLKHYER